MRISKVLLICLCCLIAAPAVWGQAATVAPKPGILGYLDPQTGAFRPLPQAVDDSAELPALTTVTGTINVTLTITLKSTGITTVTCSIDTSVSESSTSGLRSYAESNSVAGTGSGTTRTCSLSIPYSWSLSTPTSDTMSTFYSVGGAATATGGLPTRGSSLIYLDTRKVPASGTTTSLTAAVTL
jgi:hypothetical protein